MTSKRAVGILAAALFLVTAAPAAASSIVFVRGGDIHLVTPDGAREHRVTTSGGFVSATQADDGTIVGVRSGRFHRMDRHGNELSPPFAVGDPTPLSPDLSPDGSKIVFHYGGYAADARIAQTDSTSPANINRYDTQNGWYGSWISNDRALNSFAGYVGTKGLGPGNWDNWFAHPDDPDNPDQVWRMYDSALTRAGDRVVVTERDFDDVGPYRLVWYTTNGPPPEGREYTDPPINQPTLRCSQDFGIDEPRGLSWSPDGSALTIEQAGGVRVVPALDLGSCTQPPGGFTLAGASSPDFGPADVPQGGTPDTTTTDGPLQGARLAPRQRLRKALKKGVVLRVTCTTGCQVNAVIRYKRKVVAKGSRALGSGKGSVVAKFTKKGKRRLKGKRKAKLALRLTATDATGVANTGTGSFTLKR